MTCTPTILFTDYITVLKLFKSLVALGSKAHRQDTMEERVLRQMTAGVEVLPGASFPKGMGDMWRQSGWVRISFDVAG